MDFERRRHSSKFVELTFSLSEILMKASCFVVLEMIADHRFHPKLYTQNVKLKLRLVSVILPSSRKTHTQVVPRNLMCVALARRARDRT